MGLSFLLDPGVDTLTVEVAWGEHHRATSDEGQQVWRRTPAAGLVRGIPVGLEGALPPVRQSASPLGASLPPGVTVEGVDDPDVATEGPIRQLGGYRAVSPFLVNRRPRGAIGDREKPVTP